ncbi:MAG: DUF2846 domain-containing protein [Pseudomonadales bacterium]|nr:DUF2846 domain-containing protein [Pseudomonadales bacterium]
MKHLIILLVYMLTAGCSTAGKTYSQYQLEQPSLSVEKSRVYLFREWEYNRSLLSFPFRIDESEPIKVKNESFIVLDLNPGVHKFKSQAWLEPSFSELVIDLKAGKSYYIRIGNTEGFAITEFTSAVIGASNPGLMPAMAAHREEVSSQIGGPYSLELVPEKEAIEKIKELGFSGYQMWLKDDITN